jgi:hypothetical protein
MERRLSSDRQVDEIAAKPLEGKKTKNILMSLSGFSQKVQPEGLTRQSTTIHKPYGFWIPAFAGMTLIV